MQHKVHDEDEKILSDLITWATDPSPIPLCESILKNDEDDFLDLMNWVSDPSPIPECESLMGSDLDDDQIQAASTQSNKRKQTETNTEITELPLYIKNEENIVFIPIPLEMTKKYSENRKTVNRPVLVHRRSNVVIDQDHPAPPGTTQKDVTIKTYHATRQKVYRDRNMYKNKNAHKNPSLVGKNFMFFEQAPQIQEQDLLQIPDQSSLLQVNKRNRVNDAYYKTPAGREVMVFKIKK